MVIKIGSQEDPSFLQEIAWQYRPTIVIDDGSHLAHHMIASFEALFPALLPGGLYVFEDLSFHFADGNGQWLGAEAHRGASDKSIYDYLLPFFRSRLANLALPHGAWGFSCCAHENIDSITAFGGALAVKKRDIRPYGAEIAMFEAILREQTGDTGLVEKRYASYLVKHNIELARAYELLRRALDKQADDIFVLEQLYAASHRLGRSEEALDYAQRVASRRPDLVSSWYCVAEAHRILNQSEPELCALQRMTEAGAKSADVYRRMSFLHEACGDLKRAIATAQKIVELWPDDPAALTLVESLKTKLGQSGAGSPSAPSSL